MSIEVSTNCTKIILPALVSRSTFQLGSLSANLSIMGCACALVILWGERGLPSTYKGIQRSDMAGLLARKLCHLQHIVWEEHYFSERICCLLLFFKLFYDIKQFTCKWFNASNSAIVHLWRYPQVFLQLCTCEYARWMFRLEQVRVLSK